MSETFKIRIERTRDVRKLLGRQWKLCGTDVNAKYDYTPEVETVTTETCDIYTQTVDTLNLADVISAVNRVSMPAQKVPT